MIGAPGNQACSVSPANGGPLNADVTNLVLSCVNVGITVTQPVSPITTEAGGTASFSLVLISQPSNSVEIPLSSNDATEGTLSIGSAIFTSVNWNTPQSVTVTGADDAAVDGNIVYAIITGPAVSTDLAYNGINAADVPLTNTDNDTSTLTISDVTVVEGSGVNTQATFNVSSSTAVIGGFTVSYSTANGSATAPADYTTAAGILNFVGNVGEVQTLQVTVIGDLVTESSEDFLVNLVCRRMPA